MTTDKKLSVQVSNVLRANRADRKLTQKELAERSGLSQPTVSRILDNHRELKLEELAKICDGLEVSLEDVLAEANRLMIAKEPTAVARIIAD